MISIYSYTATSHHPYLRSFPTRPSSDLAKRRRLNRYTGVPGLERNVSASSGVTVPLARLSHSLRGLRPRARMSSEDRKSTRLNYSHLVISYVVFCLNT